MYSVKLISVPDIIGSNINQNCIKLFTLTELDLNFNSSFKKIEFNFSYEFNDNVVGVPFIDKECYTNLNLYHPKGSFRWRGARKASVCISGDTLNKSSIVIPKGVLLCKISLMSIQYFNLWKKSDGSDKGLRSIPIKIELINEDIKLSE